MIRHENENGSVNVSTSAYTDIVGTAVINCFGVTISIDLHIIVDNNVNLNAVGASIISEVRYVVTKCTGTEVRAVNVYIDSMVIG